MQKTNLFNKLLVSMHLRKPEPLEVREIFAPRNVEQEREIRIEANERMLEAIRGQQRRRMFGVNGRPARAVMLQKSKKENEI